MSERTEKWVLVRRVDSEYPQGLMKLSDFEAACDYYEDLLFNQLTKKIESEKKQKKLTVP